MSADEFRGFIASAIMLVGVCAFAFLAAPLLIIIASVIVWNWWKIAILAVAWLCMNWLINRYWPKGAQRNG